MRPRKPRHESEYYGSMSAGSIVGATRGVQATSGGMVRGQVSRQRVLARRSGHDERFGRAGREVPAFEGSARVACNGFEHVPPVTAEVLDAPILQPTRAIWLVLTTNAITLYDTASRRERLATYPLRKLCAVAAVPHSLGDCHATPPTKHSLILGLISHLAPTAAGPRCLLLPIAATSVCVFYFASADMQARWLSKLRQAANPQTADSQLERDSTVLAEPFGLSCCIDVASAVPFPCATALKSSPSPLVATYVPSRARCTQDATATAPALPLPSFASAVTATGSNAEMQAANATLLKSGEAAVMAPLICRSLPVGDDATSFEHPIVPSMVPPASAPTLAPVLRVAPLPPVVVVSAVPPVALPRGMGGMAVSASIPPAVALPTDLRTALPARSSSSRSTSLEILPVVSVPCQSTRTPESVAIRIIS